MRRPAWKSAICERISGDSQAPLDTESARSPSPECASQAEDRRCWLYRSASVGSPPKWCRTSASSLARTRRTAVSTQTACFWVGEIVWINWLWMQLKTRSQFLSSLFVSLLLHFSLSGYSPNEWKSQWPFQVESAVSSFMSAPEEKPARFF